MRTKVSGNRPQRRAIEGRTKSSSLLKKGCGKAVIVLVVCTAIAILNKNPQQAAPEKEFVASGSEVEIIAVENGYGYQLVYGSNVIVRQEFIPVIPGRKPFASASDAEEAATLVKNKLVNGENPGISITELRALQIIY